MTELKADLNAYLASTDPAAVKTRTLADLIAFDKATPRETRACSARRCSRQARGTKGLDDPAYSRPAPTPALMAAREGIDKLLADNKLDALIAPTTGPAWRIDIGERRPCARRARDHACRPSPAIRT